MGPNMKNRITCSNIIFFDQTQITSSVLFLVEDEEDKGNLVHKQECNIAILIGSIDTPKLYDRRFCQYTHHKWMHLYDMFLKGISKLFWYRFHFGIFE